MTERDESSSDQWTEVGDLLAKLYAIVARLEALFCDRKFTCPSYKFRPTQKSGPFRMI